MDIYIALRHQTQFRAPSVPIGAFISLEKAQAACQAVENRDTDPDGRPAGTQLTWWDGGIAAQANDGDTYEIVWAELDWTPPA